MNLIISKIKNVNLDLNVNSSDKSISHRICMLSLFANQRKKSRVKNFLKAQDTLHSLEIASKLGLKFEFQNEYLMLQCNEIIEIPKDTLYCGNSGTSLRLFTGLLAGANIYSILHGDKYLNKRPMCRILNPLRNIGLNVVSRIEKRIEGEREFAPITIIPSKKKLKAFNYNSNISSAQVKSALILCALQLDSKSYFSEISLSRDHTENMISAFQKHEFLKVKNGIIEITPFSAFRNDKLNEFDIEIPNDPSSAFFFAVLACILPNSCITLRNVLLNKTRIEAYNVLERMGANIKYENVKNDYEITGDIVVKSTNLQSIEIKENISWLIDEIPALAIAFSMAKGKSVVRNAKELRVKESDRISTLIEGLKNFGIECEEFEDGFSILGGELKGGTANSYGDHRIAMSFIIASLFNGGEVLDCECINTSFPTFFDILKRIQK